MENNRRKSDSRSAGAGQRVLLISESSKRSLTPEFRLTISQERAWGLWSAGIMQRRKISGGSKRSRSILMQKSLCRHATSSGIKTEYFFVTQQSKKFLRRNFII